MRVPCIVRWPAHIPAGKTSAALTSAMDFYPTIAGISGHDASHLPAHDGKDMRAVWNGDGAESPNDRFYYFLRNELHGVRSGQWKLRVAEKKNGQVDPTRFVLYDLANDIGETRDLAESRPEVVARLKTMIDEMRPSLGDSLQGVAGKDRRKPLLVADPKPLTRFDPEYPYVEPAYGLDEGG